MEIKFSKKEQAFNDELEQFLKQELPADWADKPVSWPHDYALSGYRSAEDTVIANEFMDKVVEKGWFTLFWDQSAAAEVERCGGATAPRRG
jgi:hypothetical protein